MDAPGVFVGFGDLLMRLEPPDHQRIVQASRFQVRYSGAEANAAVMLAGFGVPTLVASRVPDSPVGQACVNYIRAFGVDTRAIARGGERLGIFYLETGAAQRSSLVTYDRFHSAFATSRPCDYDWGDILDGAAWLHFSGTAPALGRSVRESLREGLKAAQALGVTISCDLNYRSSLWDRQEARREFEHLAEAIDVLFGNEEDAEAVFGIRARGSDVKRGMLPVDSYAAVAERLIRTYGFSVVATSLRTSVSASINEWSGMMTRAEGTVVSRTYAINPIVDRVGGGDAFAAGLVFGLLRGDEPQACVDFAAAASCLKHSIPGDFSLVDEKEVQALAAGNESGRVRR